MLCVLGTSMHHNAVAGSSGAKSHTKKSQVLLSYLGCFDLEKLADHAACLCGFSERLAELAYQVVLVAIRLFIIVIHRHLIYK
jgi:hypothetical protein